MFEKAKLTALATALGLTMVIALLASPLVRADENPFSISNAASSLTVAGEDGKCGEGKCGDSKEDEKCGDSEKESKCGDGGGDTKCGDSGDDAKCGGEGKCGSAEE